jgi:polyisoprenoid-binding protein YceI
MRNRSKNIKRLIVLLVALVIGVSAATFAYIHFVRDDSPERLSIGAEAGQEQTATTIGDPTGTWVPTSDSRLGYRVKEVLFGQRVEAVGRTDKVTGSLVLQDLNVRSVELEVDMASVASDQANRDNQFRNRIMNVQRYPTAEFVLSEPIALSRLPNAEPLQVDARGDLTLRGVTKPVDVTLRIAATQRGIEVNGSIPISFAEWDIPNPSFGPASTEDNGELELLVIFKRQ